MHTYSVHNNQSTIDSRDIIARIEELTATRDWLYESLEECQAAYNYHDSDDTKSTPEWFELTNARAALAEWHESEEAEELTSLRAVAAVGEDSPDWQHGETLIRRSYFVEYISELINDCYPIPKEMTGGEWPWRHVTIDYEAAADEAESDYIAVDFDGVAYLIRA